MIEIYDKKGFDKLLILDVDGLNGLDLRGAHLKDANLVHYELKNTDLREANLEGADLRLADLSGADLRGANLIGADLTAAILVDAKLDPKPKAQKTFSIVDKSADEL